MARVQAVVLLAQNLPLLATNNVLGLVADQTSPITVTALCGIAMLLASTAAAGSNAIRNARLP
ncbi:MAG TPA: hypothetical protein VFX33_14095 [Actinomycetales bacterium]|jgi:hypothetical protein|nr:hypothetical protein [Actinomycetales bacterium]